MRLTHRIKAISISHPISINRKIDHYLSEKLPDMIAENRIATASSISDLDGTFDGLERRMDELDRWKRGFEGKVMTDQKRMERLKLKFGVK